MFYVSFHRITPPAPGSPDMTLEFVVKNDASRVASILSYDFELWVLADPNRTSSMFLSKLFIDKISDLSKFEPHNEKFFALTWHYTPKQLQDVELWRKASAPIFEVRAEVCVGAIWPGHVPDLNVSSFAWERVWGQNGQQRGWPIRITYPLEDWVALLNTIGFRNLLLHEFPLPVFPTTFSRAAKFVSEAWDHHRAGRTDEALLACRKALECLGFDVYGQIKVAR